MSQRKKWFAKMAFGGAAVVFLVYSVSWSRVVPALVNYNWGVLAGTFFLMYVGAAISSLRWRVLSGEAGRSVPYLTFARLYLEGFFFSNLLPSSIGGDVHRTYQLSARTDQLAGSAASVLIDRFTGFLAMMLLAVGALTYNTSIAERIPIAGEATIAGLGASFFVIWAASSVRAANHISSMLTKVGLEWLARRIKKLAASIAAYRKQPYQLATAMGLSILLNLLYITSYYLFILGAHAQPVSFVDLSAIMMVAVLVAALPISVNGLGFQEGSLVIMLSRFGVAAPQALVVALLSRVSLVLLAVTGGIIWTLSGRRSVVKVETDPELAEPALPR